MDSPASLQAKLTVSFTVSTMGSVLFNSFEFGARPAEFRGYKTTSISADHFDHAQVGDLIAAGFVEVVGDFIGGEDVES